ncbi:hypothetical protein ACN4EK_01115 [Pantanalinema rosaneae CENA516]|uniref:hypothetical protein n=1 Tax=Pantanalinema rosaneae TaxID=1620701 RepID=UPI003D7018E2
MSGSLLSSERERLVQLIQQLDQAGEVAPPYCWLTETSSKKGTKTYTYVILVTQPPDRKPKSQSLGRPGSARHRHWQQAIARRAAIVELEQQLAMLEALIERQLRTWQDFSHLLVS